MQQQGMVMLNTRPQDAYKKQDVLTAGPVDLIVMLYDALKKNIILGKRGIIKKDVALAHKHLVKAQLIVTELINSLDMSYEISNELMNLYDYALPTLVQANTRKEADALDSVIDMVDNIRDAWKQISTMNRGTVKLGEELA
jgi:flagellar protein FliS